MEWTESSVVQQQVGVHFDPRLEFQLSDQFKALSHGEPLDLRCLEREVHTYQFQSH